MRLLDESCRYWEHKTVHRARIIRARNASFPAISHGWHRAEPGEALATRLVLYGVAERATYGATRPRPQCLLRTVVLTPSVSWSSVQTTDPHAPRLSADRAQACYGARSSSRVNLD